MAVLRRDCLHEKLSPLGGVPAGVRYRSPSNHNYGSPARHGRFPIPRRDEHVSDSQSMRNIGTHDGAVVGLWARDSRDLAELDRLQPVVPFGLMVVKSNPPMNAPQDTPTLFNRSPIFFPPICTVVPSEQTSQVGSRLPIMVPGSLLLGTILAFAALGMAG